MVIGVGGLALLAAPLAWRAWAAHALTADLDRRRAAGEIVGPADLPADPVADADNASLDYQAAGRLIDDQRPAWVHWWKDDTDDPATLRQIVADNGPALTRAAAARGKAAGSWHDPFLRPTLYTSRQYDLEPERNLASLLSIAARTAHADGDDVTAVARAADLCRLADAANRRPFLIGHLVADGLWSLAADTARRLAPTLAVGTPGRAAVDQWVILLLDGRTMATGNRLAWQTEQVLMVDAAREAADPGRAWRAVATGEVNAAVNAYLLGPVALTDARRLVDEMPQVIRAGQSADLPTARGLMPTGMRAMIAANPARHAVAAGWVPDVKAMETEFRCTADRRLAAIALMIRLYAIAHDGRRPPTLAGLSPVVPADPMCGRPFLYVPDGPDPRVYSVGPNGVDNGGVDIDHRIIMTLQKDRDDVVLHLSGNAP